MKQFPKAIVFLCRCNKFYVRTTEDGKPMAKCDQCFMQALGEKVTAIAW